MTTGNHLLPLECEKEGDLPFAICKLDPAARKLPYTPGYGLEKRPAKLSSSVSLNLLCLSKEAWRISTNIFFQWREDVLSPLRFAKRSES